MFHVLEVVCVCACLGEMLYVLTETLISRLLGSRLALRGPDGSIIRATANLAKSLARSTRRFIWGASRPMTIVGRTLCMARLPSRIEGQLAWSTHDQVQS